MSFERATAGTGMGAEPGRPPAEVEAASTEGIPASVRLQILSTEHWSLLASRSLAWNESFSRAGMFLSALSGAIVALALVAQASSFGGGFVLFALVILPLVLFIGLTTWIRLGASNYHDAICVMGMNRIRGAYLELAPDLERYFVMSAHDDARGVGVTMATGPAGGGLSHFLAATPVVIGIVNAVLAAVIAALVGFQLGGMPIALVLALAGFVVVAAGQFWYAARDIRRGQADLHPLFPSPGEE